MPINDGFATDENGNAGDWVELINAGNAPFNCNGLYLSNRLMEPWRWPLPSVTLEPDQHLLLWCDDNTEAGPLHANFTLSGSEDEVYLFTKEDGAWRTVDAINWDEALGNFSLGRATDGAPDWVWFNPNSSNPPTPNEANGTTANILTPTTSFSLPTSCEQPCVLDLFQGTRSSLRDVNGQLIAEFAGKSISINGQPTGIYLLTIEATAGSTTHKIILR
jgi:hypothetical protein